METTRERRIRLYFDASVFLKGVISLVEVVGGIVAFFVPVSAITDLLVHLAQGEFGEASGDFVSAHAIQLAQQLSLESGTFIALYLLSRGLIKLVLVFALLKDQLWAYPSSLAVLGLFVAYQLYQISISHSLFLVALTVFDLMVMYFIWREYAILRERRA